MNFCYKFWHKAESSLGKPTLYLLTFILLLRIVSLALYPLMDTTEGRYGEMARKMAEMNDWITPWFDVGVPFWGKPPLSFWLSSLGIKVFGVNEFAVRIPQFLAALLVIIICYDWAKRSLVDPFYTVAILSTTFLYLVLSGAVTTDVALCLGSTLSLRGFWLSLHGDATHRKREQGLFFLGLSIMLLAKGPVGWVLVFAPIIGWTLLTNSIKVTWNGLPWILGCILAILIVLPWYLIAEQHTPGFLNYFFVGEHWQRFTVSGWKGDLYGTAHARPYGSIWVYLLLASFPWCLLLPLMLWKTKEKNSLDKSLKDHQFKLYLLITGLFPCMFFTISGNVLWTYVLPGLPSLALFLALSFNKVKQSTAKRMLLTGTLISCAVFIGVIYALTLGHKASAKSAKAVVNLYKMQKSQNPLVFLGDKPFSSKFYSGGKALSINSPDELNEISKKSPVYIAVRKSILPMLDLELYHLKTIGDGENYRLYLKPSASK